MDIYGNDTSAGLTQGGEIDGDLEIVGDLDVSGTLTANTIITVDELEIKDQIITTGIDNPNDLLNGGILMEYNSSGKKWAGMLKNPADSDKICFFKEMTPKPAPGDDLNVTGAGKEANILARRLYARGDAGGLFFEDSISSGLTHAILNSSGDLRFANSGSQNVMLFDGTTDDVSIPQGKLTIGSGGSEYTMPTADGTANYVLQTDGAGSVSWAAATGGSSTLQSAFDGGQRIDTSIAKPTMILRHGLGAGAKVFKVEDDLTQEVASIDNTGQIEMNSLLFHASDLADSWSIEIEDGPDNFQIKNKLGEVVQTIEQDGTMTISPSSPTSNDFVVHNTGQITVGTDVPRGLFTLSNPTNTQLAAIEYGNSQSPASFDLYKARGTPSSPTNIISGDFLYASKAYGYHSGDFHQSAQLLLETKNTWSASSHPCDFVFKTPSVGSILPTEKFRISTDGVMSVGLSPAFGFTFPNVRGANGTVLRGDAGGNLTFQQLTPAATTDNAVVKFNTTGLLEETALRVTDFDDLQFIGAGRFDISTQEATGLFTISPGLGSEAIRIETTGITHGGTSTGFKFPAARGTANQILVSNGSGVLSFQDYSLQGAYGKGSLIQTNLTNTTIDFKQGTEGVDPILIVPGNIMRVADYLDAELLAVHPTDGITIGDVPLNNDNMNSTSDMYLNIDSDNTTTDAEFVIGKDRTVGTGGTELLKIDEAGDCTINGELLFDAGSFAGGIHAMCSLFTGTADKTVGNTTTETSIIPTGDGFLTLPANFLDAGDYLHFRVSGFIDTISAPDLTIRFKFGGTTVHTEVMTLATIPADQFFGLEADFVIRSVGATGSLSFSGNFQYSDGSVQKAVGLVETGTITVDTTAADLIEVTAQWSAAAATNTITTQIFEIEMKH